MDERSRSSSRRVAIPWGPPFGPEQTLELDLPPHWPDVEIAAPNLAGALDDYATTLKAALDRPSHGPPLGELVKRGDRVAIVVDDPSRWTPLRTALPVVLEHLRSLGIADDQISICVGVGRHQALDKSDLRRFLGTDVSTRYACYSPPLDDLSQYADMGKTSRGIPVRVFRPVAEARLRILIGSVLPHLQAGFGGGYKLIFPGCSHRSTLGALHRQGFDGSGDAARLLGGDVAENPMRIAIREAAALLPGPCFSVSHVMGSPGHVLHLATGDVLPVQSELSEHARRRFQIRIDAPGDVAIVGNHPWPGDPLMSFKSLLNHRAAVKPGGTLIGFFWADVGELGRSLPSKTLKTISASGPIGTWVIRRGLGLAEGVLSRVRHPSRFMVRWARELVGDRRVLVFCPELKWQVGGNLGPVSIFEDQETLWKSASQMLPTQNCRGLIFPFGGLSFVAS